MTAWQKLLAASNLALGTAWELISAPKLGGGEVTVVNSLDVKLVQKSYAAVLVPAEIQVKSGTRQLSVNIESTPIRVVVGGAITGTLYD